MIGPQLQFVPALVAACMAVPGFPSAEAGLTVRPALAQGPGPQVQTIDPQVLIRDAKQAFDEFKYQYALDAINQAIPIVERTPPDDPARKLLATAYEIRARSRFGLGDEAGASADFIALLKADPSYALVGEVSPKVSTLFNDAYRATVTALKVTVKPPTADVSLDGKIISPNGTVPIAVGDHVLNARQLGYKEIARPIHAEADRSEEITIDLERVSSVLRIVTAPPGVDVVIDGISQGRTRPGPPLAEDIELAAKAGIPASALSAVMLVADVATGSHRIELKRDCHVPFTRSLVVDKPADYQVGPVKLEPAVATLTAKANQPAEVLIDGQKRGITTLTIGDLCEGDHDVELRSASGRFHKRITAHAGESIPIEGGLRPAFAVIAASGSAPGLKTDLGQLVEQALETTQNVAIFAPLAAEVERATDQVQDGWLAFDGSRRPVGLAAEITAAQRRDLSARLAKTFEAQGIASVTVPAKLDRPPIVLALLASGSGEPDVLELRLDNPDSVKAAIARLDRAPVFFKPSLGLLTVDVADEPGPVIVRVDAGGPAASAGLQPGDVMLRANGQPIEDSRALDAVLAVKKADDSVTLELKSRSGTPNRADVKVVLTPRLIGIADQTLLVNRLLVDLRSRLLAPHEPLEEAVIRLNLAAALIRLDNWSDARAELQRVKLPEGPGVGGGTVQYLLGLCADRLGSRSEAEAAWRAAAGSESLLTEDGPSVKELAEARLADLQRRSSS